MDDPSAFFSDHYPNLFRFVARLTGGRQDEVEDLVQETLLEAWENRARFRGEASPFTWILAIARNRVSDYWRRRGRGRDRQRVLESLAAFETDPIPEELLQADELRSRVRRALELIDPSYANLLLRRYLDGLSIRGIAEALGEGEKAVESRLHRAREAFRKQLEAGGQDDES